MENFIFCAVKRLVQIIAVFVIVNASNPCNPIVIWQSQLPCCFRRLTVTTCPAWFHYFTNAKSWMNTEIMEHILGRLDRQLKLENCHVIIFLDNATSHPESLQDPWHSSNWYFCQKIQPLSCNLQMQELFEISKPNIENAWLYLF